MTVKMSDVVMETLKSRAEALAENVIAHNALWKKLMAGRPKPKTLTKRQLAKRDRDRKRGEKYLAKAHALGVYEEPDLEE